MLNAQIPRRLPTLLGAVFLAACFSSPVLAAPAPQAVTPVPGDLAISEVLFDSASAVDDNDGEWFEVTNVSMKALDLGGLYVQDLETPGSATAPYFQIPAGALPALYPGASFVFARNGSALANGGITAVHYEYSVATGVPVPADKSKVSHTGMAFSNSSIDAVFLTTGAPANLGGFVIESITYDPTTAPLTSHNGIAFERANLYAPWQATNLTASAATFGSAAQKGTPGSTNSNDTTLYSTWSKYFPVAPGAGDVGALTAVGAASIQGGAARLRLSGGPPFAQYAVGYALAPAQVPFSNGTLLLELGSALFIAVPSLSFDAGGQAGLDVPLGAALIGAQAHLQWFSFDPAAGFVLSNGLSVDVAP